MRRVNLIPMAGEGIRFINAGYDIPKPMIKINGLPMIISSAKSLPDADIWIFICRKQHVLDFKIDILLKKHFPSSVIISVDYLTDGQASTCLLAQEYLNPDDILIIGSCDNKIEFDNHNYQKKIKSTDALVWTFRNNKTVVKNPAMYGWANLDPHGRVSGVSCKTPLSDNPINDHALVGAFSFKRAEYFLKYTNKIIKKNRRINNEFYLDIVIDECAHSNLIVESFEVSNYICWGTPKDLEDYERSFID